MVTWEPHVYRDSATGDMKADPTIEHASSTCASEEPGAMRVTLAPTMGRVQIIAMSPGWANPYYVRSWEEREDARRVAEALLEYCTKARGLPRENLYRVVDRLEADLRLTAT